MKAPETKKLIWPVFMATFLILLIIGIFLLPAGKNSVSFNGLILVIAAIYAAYILFASFEAERDDFNPFSESLKKAIAIMIFVTAAGLILRVLIGLAVPGYPADMSCWTAWSQAAAGSGLFSVYENTTFLDYPPGYLYILHILGSVGNMLGIECGSSAYNLLLKIPAILADIGMAWMLFIIGKKEKSIKIGLLIAVLYTINPLTILNSAAWGQIDSILTLAVAGYLILLYRKRIFAATLVFVAGLLLKPQMLFFGPVLAVVFIKHLSEDGIKAGLKTFLLSFTGGAALFVITVLPFSIGKEWTWILDKYMGTINSYPYATLNAANIFGMLKLNWQSLENTFLGLKLSTWGMAGLAFSVTVYFVIAFINKRKDNIFILSALLMTGIYALGHKMHERYLFPIMAVLLFGFIYTKRGATIFIYGLLSTAIFINVAQVLAVTHIPKDDALYRISSLVVVISYIFLLVACTVFSFKSRKEPEAEVAISNLQPDESGPDSL
ncbi:MAG: hypothetical protein JXN10_10370 [Clostridia bacterium]|nr:hypothetical protein [Clostridia bacterium]